MDHKHHAFSRPSITDGRTKVSYELARGDLDGEDFVTVRRTCCGRHFAGFTMTVADINELHEFANCPCPFVMGEPVWMRAAVKGPDTWQQGWTVDWVSSDGEQALAVHAELQPRLITLAHEGGDWFRPKDKGRVEVPAAW